MLLEQTMCLCVLFVCFSIVHTISYPGCQRKTRANTQHIFPVIPGDECEDQFGYLKWIYIYYMQTLRSPDCFGSCGWRGIRFTFF